MKNIKIFRNIRGFSLVELVVVIIIIGILSTVGIRSILRGTENARVQETMREMEAIVKAVIGDPSLVANGVRTDFGYVGDCGAWPTSPNNLITNPGYPNWSGPYISTGFDENPNDFIQDAWGNNYAFTQTTIQSTEGGSGSLTKTIIPNLNDALSNTIFGNVTDWNGSAPKDTDLANFIIYCQTQSGGIITTPYVTISQGGVFAISGVHIGNHLVVGHYSGVPGVDSVRKYVSVDVKSATRVDLRFLTTFFGTGPGGGSGTGTQTDYFEVSGSNEINNNYLADGMEFENTSDEYDVVIEEITLTWSDAVSQEKFIRIDIDGVQVWDGGFFGQKSGTTAVLLTPYTLNPGDKNISLEIYFKSSWPSQDPIGKFLTLGFQLSDGSVETYPE